MVGPGGRPLMIYLATRPVHSRKGHDGLSALVQEMFGLDPLSGTVLVFRSSLRAFQGRDGVFRSLADRLMFADDPISRQVWSRKWPAFPQG